MAPDGTTVARRPRVCRDGGGPRRTNPTAVDDDDAGARRAANKTRRRTVPWRSDHSAARAPYPLS